MARVRCHDAPTVERPHVAVPVVVPLDATRAAACTGPPVKSSVDEIRRRFDADVERFADLETGQVATIDARLSMDLVVEAAAAVRPNARHVLDLGCGAGNYTLALLQRLPDLDATLVDLSEPMLVRAAERVGAATRGTVTTIHGDVREVALGSERFDVVVAAAVFHHLREDAEWRQVFEACHRALVPGGCLWIVDLVAHAQASVAGLMWARYGEYLAGLRGEAYRDEVFAYVEREDSPRPLVEQLTLLRAVGFDEIDVLHKNGCFAAFGGRKPVRG